MKCAMLVLAALACLGAQGAALADEESIRLTEGVGRDLTSANCAICHSLDYIPMNSPVMNRAAWDRTVQKMIARFGAPIDDAAARGILDYLSTYYAAAPPPSSPR